MNKAGSKAFTPQEQQPLNVLVFTESFCTFPAMIQPQLENVPAFYQGYVNHVKNMDLMEALRHSGQENTRLIYSIPEDMGEYRYADGKWSIKELICHVMDAERIFAYRALRFAREDKTSLPGFDENSYAPRANAHARKLHELADEAARLRTSTIDLYLSFTPQMLRREGTASNVSLSVVNLGFIIAGHETHHRSILQQRYLV